MSNLTKGRMNVRSGKVN